MPARANPTYGAKLVQRRALERNVDRAEANVHANVGREVVRIAEDKGRLNVRLVGVKLVRKLRDCGVGMGLGERGQGGN